MLTHHSLFLELGIFISQFIWLWRTRHIRKAAKKAGKTYDEYIAEKPSPSPSSTDLEKSQEKKDVEIESNCSNNTTNIVMPPRCKLPTQSSESLDSSSKEGLDLEKGLGRPNQD